MAQAVELEMLKSVEELPTPPTATLTSDQANGQGGQRGMTDQRLMVIIVAMVVFAALIFAGILTLAGKDGDPYLSLVTLAIGALLPSPLSRAAASGGQRT